MYRLTDDQLAAAELLRSAELPSEQGLPEPLFLLASALVPLPNIDLLVVNGAGQLLLSRRSDPFFEHSWHIPGGCMRYGESFEQRIQATAVRELGCEVTFDSEPLAVRNVLRGGNRALAHPRERGHNVAILFRCALPETYRPDNGDKTENDAGYLRWFDRLPPDFMKLQYVYDDILTPWKEKTE